jgi:hypothetical protein
MLPNVDPTLTSLGLSLDNKIGSMACVNNKVLATLVCMILLISAAAKNPN